MLTYLRDDLVYALPKLCHDRLDLLQAVRGSLARRRTVRIAYRLCNERAVLHDGARGPRQKRRRRLSGEFGIPV